MSNRLSRIREGDTGYPDNWNDLLLVLSHYTSLFDFLIEEESN